LGDCDPYGLDILFNYTFSNEYQTFEMNNLPQIHYIGLSIEDLLQFKISESSLLVLNEQDFEKLNELKTRQYFLGIMEENDRIGMEDVQIYQRKKWKKWYQNILDFEKSRKKLELDSFEEISGEKLIDFIKYKILISN
jgi:DNA topoisomerase VI subunit A